MSWSKPSNDQIDAAVRKLTDPTLRLFFYSKLRNPEWLQPLAARRAFSDPGVSESDSGLVSNSWPETAFLLAITEERPQEVAAILKRLRTSDNHIVQGTIIAAAARMPPREIIELMPSLIYILENTRSPWLDFEDLLQIAQNLGNGGKRKQQRQLLNALFTPVRNGSTDSIFGSRPLVASRLETYQNELALRAVRSQLTEFPALNGLKLAIEWLQTAITILADGNDESRKFAIHRPSIEDHAQNMGLDSVPDSLLECVREVASTTYTSAARGATRDILLSSKDLLIRRVAIYTIAKSFDFHSQEDIDSASGILLDVSLMAMESRVEYAQLAKAALESLSDESVARWSGLVMAANWVDEGELSNFLTEQSPESSAAEIAAEVALYLRRATHQMLAAVGSKLPGQLQDELAELNLEFGHPDHPEFGSFISSSVGDRSPVLSADLEQMAAPDVLRLLQTWRSPQNTFSEPTTRGLAQSLQAAIESRPNLLGASSTELASLPPTYSRAVFEGWSRAISNSNYSPTSADWRLLAFAAEQDADSNQPGREDFHGHDPSWAWAQRAAVRVVEQYARSAGPQADLRSGWSVIKTVLTGFEHPFDGLGELSGMDPLTASLNQLTSSAVRAALLILGRGPEPSTIADILRVLEPAIRLNDLAVAAAFGENLAALANYASGFFEDHLDDFFDVLANDDEKRSWADACTSVALRSHRHGRGYISLLRPALTRILSPRYLELTHTEGWNSQSSTLNTAAFAVINGIVIGAVDRGDALEQAAFRSTESAAVAYAIGHIGWMLMRGRQGEGDIPREYVDSAAALVEQRVAAISDGVGSVSELAEFAWWARSDFYPVSWWLPIIEIASDFPDFDPRSLLDEPLEKASYEYPVRTALVLEKLVSRTSRDRIPSLRRSLPLVLARALDAADPTGGEVALRIIDKQVRDGNVGLMDEVERAQRGPEAEPSD